MTEQQKDVAAASSAAGNNAYRIIEQYGVETGSLILRHIVCSYLRALAAVEGWPAAMDLTRQLHNEHVVPLRGQKLTIAWSRDADLSESKAS